ncbi:MAG: adenylate/guanylate cyclase domain-containing protein [Alphaproteobacteria bacterium]|nr:adenylate/guanylate cyclase domain-containing protein [Alphaproteobacteria bacterium]
MAEKIERRLAAILSADVVGYSRLMEGDEAGTLARLQALLAEFIEPAIAEHRGRVVKLMGDGVLVEFASVIDAAQCAAHIQRGMAERNTGEPDQRRMDFRIGINVGDIIIEGDDIHGEGVNVAARLQALAEPGGIRISGESYRQVEGKVDVGFADLGDQTVKNIAKPIRVYRVLLEAEAAGTLIAQKKAGRQPFGRRRWAIPSAAAMVIIAIAAAVLLSLEPWVPRVEAAVEANMAFALPDQPSIAILPFENLSGDPEQDYLADGITETLITALSQTEQLFVIARKSSFKFKDNPVSVRQVAEEFGVQHVLEGSFQKSGEAVRITARLIDALSGRQMWAGRYDRPISDIFALQDDITTNIVEGLQIKLTVGEQGRVWRRTTNSAEAYQLIMKARELFWRYTPESHAEALALAEQALALDPKYASAEGMRALILYNKFLNGWTDDPMLAYSQSIEALEKAMALDDTIAWLHLHFAWVKLYSGERDEAFAAAEKGIALAPGGADVANQYASVLVQAGRPEEAIEWFNRGKRLNPNLEVHQHWVYSEALRQLGRYDEMIEVAHTMLDNNPDSWWERPRLVFAYMKLGREEDAQAQLKDLLARHPESVQVWPYGVSTLPEAMRADFVGTLQMAGFPGSDKPVQ